MTRRMRLLCLLGALALASGCERGAVRTPEREPVRVAAASDLSLALGALAPLFEHDTGLKLVTTFGSSGMLTKQLREGAPFDLFAAASKSYVDEVVRAKVCDDATRAAYGRGRLALLASPGTLSKSGVPRSLHELTQPSFRRIAVAQPEHAPYGKAARELLVSLGLWEQLRPRLVYAENVRQTVQLAQTDNVEAALTALSLVLELPTSSWLLLDEHGHAPLEQEFVACSRGKAREGGQLLAAYLGTPRARAVLNRYGFVLPGESLVSAP